MKNKFNPVKTGFIGLCALSVLLLSNCKKETEEIDTTYPEIISSATSFPQQCSVIKRGETFTFKTQVSDNVELGSMSIDIHHNFDHHSHSTEVNSCNMEAIKTPVKPFLLIREVSIPAGQRNYEATASVNVPADIDPGDYHFLIRVTDKAGWQTIKGISIKIN
ncbi:MAG: DUF4625 domain-containing protein [Pedobacter agri]